MTFFAEEQSGMPSTYSPLQGSYIFPYEKLLG